MKVHNLIGRDGITGIKGKVMRETNEEAILIDGRLVTADPVTSPDVYWIPITGVRFLRLVSDGKD